MNTTGSSRLRLSSAFLLASTAMLPALFISAPAHADTTAPCNTDNGPDNIAGTADDGLECGEDASADGANATAVGNDADASGDFSVAVGDSAAAAADRGTAVGQFAQAGDDASDINASAFGQSAQATAAGATALGAASDATGANSTAVAQTALPLADWRKRWGKITSPSGGQRTRAIQIRSQSAHRPTQVTPMRLR